MIKERDINYEIDMMNKPTRFLQEEKIRKKKGVKEDYVFACIWYTKTKLVTLRLEIAMPA